MMTHVRLILVTVAMAGTVCFAAAAAAKDFCIDDEGTSDVALDFVGEGFVVPKPGRCRPFVGRGITSEYGPNAIHGVGCTTPSGDTVSFTLTLGRAPSISMFDSGDVHFYLVKLSLPGLSGEVTMRNADNSGSIVGAPAHGFTCVRNAVP